MAFRTGENGMGLEPAAAEQAIARLRESEELLRQSQRVARVGHYVFDIPADRWTGSEVLSELFGLDTSQPLTAADWVERLHPEDRAATAAYFQREVLGDRRPFDREYRIVSARDGRIRWVHGRGTLDLDVAGAPVRMFGTIQDITARKEAELALAESDARLRSVFDAVREGLVVADVETRRFLLCNRAFAELVGRTVEDVLRRGVDDIHPAADLPEVLRHFERLARSELELAPDIPVLRAGGAVVYCDVRAASVLLSGRRRLVGSFRDVTERRRAEEQLRLKNFMFHSALTGNSIADVDGVIVEANRAFLRMWGYAELRDVIGKAIPAFVADRDEAAAILAALDTVGEWEGDYVGLRGDGSTFVAHGLATVLRDDRGRVVGYQSAVRDVTDERRFEAERERLRAQLLQAQKMESIGRLAGGVAHDFNNMLEVIVGYAALLLDDIRPGHPYHAAIAGIRDASRRSAELTRQLLAFARKQTASPRVLDLNETIAETLGLLRRLIGEEITLSWAPGPELWSVRLDPAQVDQVLTNLCVNARDAIPGVGRITVQTANQRVDPAWCRDHPGATPGDYVLLRVSDTGQGMSAAVREHIFEPFFTTRDQSGGTGLGLAMVYGIVTQNGGFIDVDSREGSGTTFRLFLPRHAGAASQPVAEPAHDSLPVPDATILVVEDETMVLDLCRLMLERSGYRVLTAATPTAAFELARAHAGEIRLLLSDVAMPEMNGHDLARALAERLPGLRCLFMSGYPNDALSGSPRPDLPLVQKPFTRQQLAQRVREALDGPA
jgi:PAS domain S-box-containing protein